MIIVPMEELENIENTNLVKVISQYMTKDDILKKFVSIEDNVKQLFRIFYEFDDFEMCSVRDENEDITDLINMILVELYLPPLENKYVRANGLLVKNQFDVVKELPLMPIYEIWKRIISLDSSKEYALVEINEKS